MSEIFAGGFLTVTSEYPVHTEKNQIMCEARFTWQRLNIILLINIMLLEMHSKDSEDSAESDKSLKHELMLL